MVKAVKKRIIILAVLIIILVIILLLKKDIYISEYVFARAISRFFIQIIGGITSVLPFSLYEILIVFGALFLIVFIAKLIKNLINKKYYNALNKALTLICVILSFLLVYNITASFSYNRYPLNLSLTQKKPSKEKVLLITQTFLEDFNTLAQNFERDEAGNIKPPYSFNELSKRLQNEYKNLYSDYFGSPQTAKPLIFSEIMSYMGFSGVFMSVTGEPNININIPTKDLPFVTAHEMAHSMGVMRENEANLLSFYVLLNSSDDYLRYSGYCATFYQMMSAVYFACEKDDYNALLESYSPLIKKENLNAAEYWKKYSSFLNSITNFINDLYLKSSGVNNGTQSYENPYEVIDTGQTDEQGEIIYEIDYSLVQKIYFTLYDLSVA